MPGNDFIERAAEDGLIERSVPAEREAHIERGIAAWLQLIEEPKAPLRWRSRKNEDARRVGYSHVVCAIDLRCDRRGRQGVIRSHVTGGAGGGTPG